MPTRNATKKRTNAPKRKAKTSGRHHRVSAAHGAPSRRTRAAQASQADKVVSGRRGVAESSVIEEPQAKVVNTRAREPKHVPLTGVAKRRKRT
jgi:hypothetical protein